MSKEINNTEHRKNAIKEILKKLHYGASLEEAQEIVRSEFDGVSASEISAAEQALISEGLPVTEIQRLCDVHAAVFKGSIEEIHAVPETERPGHPARVVTDENAAITGFVEGRVLPALSKASKDFGENIEALRSALDKLAGIKVHYQRKENLIFPYLEKHGITGPPKVMWGVDDEIRNKIRLAREIAAEASAYSPELEKAVKEACDGVLEMIFKEQNILLPMLSETLTPEEWGAISAEIPGEGYFLIDPQPVWVPRAFESGEAESAEAEPAVSGGVRLPTGVLTMDELTGLLNTLPVDITFVDKDDNVKFFSENSERIFPRTKAIIGRKVINCHPPQSMHVVEMILHDFKAGIKDEESFWINMAGKYIHIRYFAVRGKDGEYLGTLEVTQNIAPLQAITGEKRLLTRS